MTDTTPVSANKVERFAELITEVRNEVRKVIVGQDEMVNLTLQCLFCHNHALLEGVPGLAKTLLVTTIAKVLELHSSRIQFTPDLMPSDVTGSEIIQEDVETGKRRFEFIRGPIFTNLLLADEINRTPPRTQSALLEAMQERQVSVGNTKYKLDEPFFVLATQNPIEQEGTYSLPEAQLDRFMFLIAVDYPEREDELEIVRRTTGSKKFSVETVMPREVVLEYQEIVRNILIRDEIIQYIVDLVRSTRVSKDYCCEFTKKYVAWGAGPRACQNLALGAKANALFNGRPHVTCEDVRTVAYPVLRHRVLVNYHAVSEGVGSHDVVRAILEHVKPPA